MDLSRLSNDDLLALKSGDMSAISDDGLLALSGKAAPEEPGGELQPYGRGLARQGLQGMTFGFSDEIGAGVAAVPTAIETGQRVGPAFMGLLDLLEGQRKAFKKENPKSALAAELVGGLTTGGTAAAKMAKAMKDIRPLTKAATIGATEGGVYGLGSADEGERLSQAGLGATAGAVFAPLVQFAGSLASRMGAPVAERATDAVVGTSSGDARKYLASVLAREGVDSVDDLAARVPEKSRGLATIADVSEGGRGALEGIVSDVVENPNIRRMTKEALEARNKQQASRVMDTLSEGLEVPADSTYKTAIDALRKQRGAKAGELYGAARSKPLQMTDYMKAVFENDPQVKAALRKAQQRTATKRAAGDEISHIDVIDEMKRELDDTINTLYRQGKNNRARDLVRVKNQILKDVDSQIPEYKAARNQFASDSSLIDAAEKGKMVLRGDIDELGDIVGAMSKSELEMFRLGAKKAVREKLMAGREGTNTVNRIMSEMNLERLKRAFPDEKGFDAFKKELQFEAELFDTSRVLQNSMTALRQAAQRSMDTGSIDIAEYGTDSVGIAAKAIQRLLNKGLDRDAKEELGRMLLTPINDLPEDIVKRLNNRIVNYLPAEQRGKALQLIRQARGAYVPTSTALPAVSVPISMNQEQ